jgi:hypothetical protein
MVKSKELSTVSKGQIVTTVSDYLQASNNDDVRALVVMRKNCDFNIPTYADAMRRYKLAKAAAEQAKTPEQKKNFMSKALAIVESMAEAKSKLCNEIADLLADASDVSRELIISRLSLGAYDHKAAIRALTNPLEVYHDSKCITVYDAVDGDTATISALKGYAGLEATKSFLRSYIARLDGLIYGNTINDTTRNHFCDFVIARYSHLTIDDFKAFENKLLSTKIYGSFDYQTLTELLEGYNQERLNYSGEKSYNAHENNISKMGGRDNIYRIDDGHIQRPPQDKPNYTIQDIPEEQREEAQNMYKDFVLNKRPQQLDDADAQFNSPI